MIRGECSDNAQHRKQDGKLHPDHGE